MINPSKLSHLIVARITGYDVSNILLGGKIIFIPQERRETTKADHPIGEIAKVTVEGGALKDITKAQGSDLDEFLKEEEARRTVQPLTATEKIRSESPIIEKMTRVPQNLSMQPPESNSLAIPLDTGSKVNINPVLINDSFRESPAAKEPQCELSGPCIKARCRKFVSCWTAEIKAMRQYGLHNAAAALEGQLKEILGE
jgi:hypothetical protein